jgi:hypothetical protein
MSLAYSPNTFVERARNGDVTAEKLRTVRIRLKPSGS